MGFWIFIAKVMKFTVPRQEITALGLPWWACMHTWWHHLGGWLSNYPAGGPVHFSDWCKFGGPLLSCSHYLSTDHSQCLGHLQEITGSWRGLQTRLLEVARGLQEDYWKLCNKITGSCKGIFMGISTAQLKLSHLPTSLCLSSARLNLNLFSYKQHIRKHGVLTNTSQQHQQHATTYNIGNMLTITTSTTCQQHQQHADNISPYTYLSSTIRFKVRVHFNGKLVHEWHTELCFGERVCIPWLLVHL